MLLICTLGSGAVFAWDAKDTGDVRSRAKRWRSRGVRTMLGGDGTDALRAIGAGATIVRAQESTWTCRCRAWLKNEN